MTVLIIDVFEKNYTFIVDNIDTIKTHYEQLVITVCDTKNDTITDLLFTNVVLKSFNNNKFIFEAESIKNIGLFSLMGFLYPDHNTLRDVFKNYDGKIIAISGSELDIPREELIGKNFTLTVITGF